MHEEILMLALVLGAALLGGRLAARFGYPAILGEIAAGILLGPPLIGILVSNQAIEILGEFGILLMMLYIGMHLDLGHLRHSSMASFLAAFGGFVVPASAGLVLMLAVGRTFLEALFVGLGLGVTSLVINSRILVDLKILDTRIAHVLVAGALLSDVTVLLVFSAVVGPDVTEGVSIGGALFAGGKALAFGLGAWLVGRRLLPAVKQRLVGNRDLDRGAVLLAVVVFGLAFAYAGELAGIHAILGAFVAGLFIDKKIMEPKVSKDVQQKLAVISVGILGPFFFVSAGFEVSLGVFLTDLPLLLGVIVIATVGKVLGTALFYIPSGNGWREGVVVGAGMNGRGAVEIIVAEIALAQGLIDREVFSILVFMALFTTATVPVLLTVGVRWLRRRGELVRAGGRDQALIIGAGVIARRLGQVLKQTMPVTMLDTNRANLRAGEREGLDVKAGSGLDEVALESAGIESALRVIAATPNAEVNVLTAQLALDFGVPDVSVLLRESDTKTFESRLADADIKVIRAPEDFAAWEHALTSGRAVAETVDGPDELNRFRDASNPLWVAADEPTGEFPITVISNGERTPYTTEVKLSDGEHIVVLRRLDLERNRTEAVEPVDF
jgi:Kef-type K+ transport system membrane component KefB